MANEENLIPFSERTESEQRRITQKGGQASGRSRRAKSDFKKAAETLLALKMPPNEITRFLETYGIEPTFENGITFSTLYEGIKNGDINALMKFREITGQHRTTEDRQEQRARIERLRRETEVKSEVSISFYGERDIKNE